MQLSNFLYYCCTTPCFLNLHGPVLSHLWVQIPVAGWGSTPCSFLFPPVFFPNEWMIVNSYPNLGSGRASLLRVSEVCYPPPLAHPYTSSFSHRRNFRGVDMCIWSVPVSNVFDALFNDGFHHTTRTRTNTRVVFLTVQVLGGFIKMNSCPAHDYGCTSLLSGGEVCSLPPVGTYDASCSAHRRNLHHASLHTLHTSSDDNSVAWRQRPVCSRFITACADSHTVPLFELVIVVCCAFWAWSFRASMIRWNFRDAIECTCCATALHVFEFLFTIGPHHSKNTHENTHLLSRPAALRLSKQTAVFFSDHDSTVLLLVHPVTTCVNANWDHPRQHVFRPHLYYSSNPEFHHLPTSLFSYSEVCYCGGSLIASYTRLIFNDNVHRTPHTHTALLRHSLPHKSIRWRKAYYNSGRGHASLMDSEVCFLPRCMASMLCRDHCHLNPHLPCHVLRLQYSPWPLPALYPSSLPSPPVPFKRPCQSNRS